MWGDFRISFATASLSEASCRCLETIRRLILYTQGPGFDLSGAREANKTDTQSVLHRSQYTTEFAREGYTRAQIMGSLWACARGDD